MTSFLQKAQNSFVSIKSTSYSITRKHPFLSIAVLLMLFILLLFGGKVLSTKKPIEQPKLIPKEVTIYRIGQTPTARYSASIEKTGVVTITSLSGGVVSSIAVGEGDLVKRGNNLVVLTTNYQGGNAFGIQRQLAQKQQEIAEEQYKAQIEVIGKQREVLNKSSDNSEELRKITEQSFLDSENLITLNDNAIKLFDNAIAQYLIDNGTNANDSTLRGLYSSKSQLQSANLSLSSSLRANKYSANRDNPPKKLEELQKEIAQKQLNLQEKIVTISKEVSNLQVSLAYVQEALMYPSAPFSGQIQRVFVKEGQAVSPGTPLVLIAQSAEDDPATAIVYVSKSVAESVQRDISATVYLSKSTIQITPSFITTEPVQGQLFAIYLPIPDELISQVHQAGTVEVDIPIGRADTNSAVPYIPLESVSQTQTGDYVFIIDKTRRALAVPVNLGQVIGRLVEVTSGLENRSQIILDQTITTGEEVTIAK